MLLLSLIAATVAGFISTTDRLTDVPIPSYRLLFLGNSHTLNNDIPESVKSLLESSGSMVSVQTIGGSLLDDLSQRKDVREAIANGKWTHVVLQGANMSSSHKYEYSKQPGIDLVNLVNKSGAKALLYAEHPRKGWDEAAWIYGQYEQIQKKAKCEIIPCPFAFQIALAENPELQLWMADGNHASLAGSFLNALTIAQWIGGLDAKLTLVPKSLDSNIVTKLRRAAFSAVRRHRLDQKKHAVELSAKGRISAR